MNNRLIVVSITRWPTARRELTAPSPCAVCRFQRSDCSAAQNYLYSERFLRQSGEGKAVAARPTAGEIQKETVNFPEIIALRRVIAVHAARSLPSRAHRVVLSALLTMGHRAGNVDKYRFHHPFLMNRIHCR